MESFQQAVIESNSVPQQQLAINVRDVTLVDNDNNKVTVLNGLSLDVPRGTIFALLGPSGCGKTSLIQCIFGYLKPTTGSINVFGLSPYSTHLNAQGSTIGYYMPQDTSCLSPEFTIDETLTNFGTLYGLDGTQLGERCESLVQLLKLPQTDLLVGGMSVDQKRRVSLATALIHKPALLLLDEPTVGVEPLLRKSIWQYLVGLCEADHVTVLYTTKYIDEAKNANLIGLMHHGNILAQDSLTALLVRFQMGTLEQVSL